MKKDIYEIGKGAIIIKQKEHQHHFDRDILQRLKGGIYQKENYWSWKGALIKDNKEHLSEG